ncbi:Uncharacterised protein [Escherichia coli]|nr:Uncharacterised protein [Escherichia coli]
MFNLQTLTAKARELRGNVVKATTTKGTRTMTPVYEREEQRKLRERIQQTQPDWVLLWWDIATVTGWRTSDVCNFRYSCINWETVNATMFDRYLPFSCPLNTFVTDAVRFPPFHHH